MKEIVLEITDLSKTYKVTKKQQKVIYVGVEGQVRYSKRIKSLYCHIMKMKTIAETEIRFATEWRDK